MATINGTSGNDSLSGTAGDDTLFGFAGDDTLQGLGGNDSLSGGAGVDFLQGGLGDDTLDGGADFDFADNRNALGAVIVNLALATATGEGTDTLISIEGAIGSAFDDTLIGDDGTNVFRGAGGADTVDGAGGNDAIDFLLASAAVSVDLTSGQVDYADGTVFFSNIEWARGSQFDDTLVGDAGDNRFRGWAGNDTIDGGAGFDVADYAVGASGGVTVNLAAGTASGGAGNDTLISIEGAIGTQFGDTLIGDDGGNQLIGGGGNDRLVGRAGDDTLDGGAGFDTVYYRYNDFGGGPVPSAGVTVNLATGVAIDNWGNTDTLSNIELVFGSDFDDVLTGGNPANGSGATDGFEGFRGEAGNDTIDGGTGYDRVYYDTSPTGVVVTLGGGSAGTASDGFGGTDTLISIEEVRGSSHDDVLTGSDADDYFEGRAGNDTIDGRSGNDRANYETSPGGVVVDLSQGSASDGWGGTDALLGIEYVRGSEHADQLTGDDNANQLQGRGGNDILHGLDGRDTLQGGAGNDTLDGGENSLWFQLDFVDYGDIGGGGVTVNLAAGTATGAGGSDTLISIEGVIGSGSSDYFVGGDAPVEYFWGGAGNDTIDGGVGHDIADYNNAPSAVVVDLVAGTASGGHGNDTLIAIEAANGSNFDDLITGNDEDNVLQGNGGNDTLIGGLGADRAQYSNAKGSVVVDLAAGTANGGDGEDILEGIEHLSGSSLDDTLLGDAGDNWLRGMGGNDTLDGRDGVDMADYLLALGSVTVDLAAGTASGADGDDTLISIEDVRGSLFGDLLIGNDGANQLIGDDTQFGSGGDDTLAGGMGDDTLIGSVGDDALDGGEGSDTAGYGGALASAFTVTRTGSGYTVTDLAGVEGTDTLTGVERLQFEDFAVNLTVQDAAAGLARSDLDRLEELYVAFFNRTPDADGLEYWIGRFEAGMTIEEIAESFYAAGILFSDLTGYSPDMTDADFVNTVYRNVLGREDGADAEGLAYWTGELAAGRESRGSLVSTILDSAHSFKGDETWGWVADLLDNKIEVADTFAVQWGLNFNTPEESIAQGMAIAAAVTPEGTDAALELIGIEPGQIDLVA